MANYKCLSCYSKFKEKMPQLIGGTVNCPFCGSENVTYSEPEPKPEPKRQVRFFNPAVSVDSRAYKPYSYIKYDYQSGKVLALIADSTKGLPYSSILFHLGMARTYNTVDVDRTLRKLELTGLIYRPKRGLYKVTKEGKKADYELHEKDIYRPNFFKTDLKTGLIKPKELKCVCEQNSVLRCREPHMGYICTRHKGHSGPHVACGQNVHRIEEWD